MKKRKRKPKPQTIEWLLAQGKGGAARIQTLGWKRLARMYHASKPNSPIRRAINAEAHRCGYTPKTILALNA